MVTPKKISYFLGIVLFSLFLISLCFPNGEIRISEKSSLKFPSLSDVFNPREVEYADISSLIEKSEKLEDSLKTTTSKKKKDIGSPVKPVVEKRKIDTIKANKAKLLQKTRKIEYPGNDKKVLNSFFKELSRVGSLKQPIRILHYGDSQIEGDRITSFVRDRLQKRFGGSGAGLLPVVQPYGQFSMKQDVSDNWKRYTLFGKKDSTLYHSRYGALASFCRFSPHIQGNTKESFEGWMKLQRAALGYSTVRKYERLKIFYGYNKKPFLAQVYNGDEMVYADFIPVANDVQVFKLDFNTTPKDLIIKFKGDDSPDFYALSFESKKGVLVDNIPMRGSSGLVFTKMDRKLLKGMYDELNVKLLILQYGGNVVPYIKGDGEYYGKLFYNQLKRLKSLLPGVSIVVIGLADMSVKEKDYYVTYPVLPKVRDALKKATFQAGCAYWDMYEAMGGENSMPSWVFADPPLASSDFVHFNHRGARLVAEMFYKALMIEYNSYCDEYEPKKIAMTK